MPRVIRQIIDWMGERPYWEQACFEKILENEALNDADYDELLTYLLQDGGLSPMPEERPQISFLQEPFQENEEDVETRILIRELSNLKNINALADNQRLTFHPQLTIIFGANGSGKSGYARVLGNASFTRGDEDVLPNINKPERENLTQTADIRIELNGAEKIFTHRINSRNRFLDSFYMFDTTSVKQHLSGENQMSFSPAGLDLLSKLVEVTDGVRSRLDSEIDRREQPNIFVNSLTGETPSKEWLQNINADTQIAELTERAKWTDINQTRYKEIDKRIAELKSENIQEKIDLLEEKAEDIKALKTEIGTLTASLSMESQKALLSLIKDFNKYHSQLEFFSDPEKIDEWKIFIDAAKDYANTFDEYPTEEDHCLFCGQALTQEASEHIRELWRIIEENAYQQLNQGSREISRQLQDLKGLKINLLDEQKVAYRHLREDDRKTLAVIQSFLDSCCEIRKLHINHLNEKSLFEPKPLTDNGLQELDALLGSYGEKIKELRDRSVDVEIQNLSEEKLELEHRHFIHQHEKEIAEYIKTLHWIAKAEDNSIRGTTHAITRKYGELFKNLVTDEYIRLFEQTLNDLCCPMNLGIATKNKKGNTFRQVSLIPETEGIEDLPSPHKVLSEGEQRAVALADFFTEVALDTNARGVVLDDPITSLDFNWQELIANYIVQEAGRQQVIVFTHDLHFMECLTVLANNNVGFDTHKIEKRQGIPGLVFLNNSPATESNYNNANIPMEYWEEARDINLPPKEVERSLKEGFGSLRTCYEYLVIHRVLGDVVQRYRERISIGRLKDICLDPKIHKKIISKMELLSRHIEGHLHSNIHNAQPPTPDQLKQEIDDYIEISREVKEAIKARS